MDDDKENKEERVFLHDMSNQLLVAHGMGTYVNKIMKEKFPEDSKEFQRSEKTMIAINKIIELVKDRRDNLYAESND
jgi:hypothetical protein